MYGDHCGEFLCGYWALDDEIKLLNVGGKPHFFSQDQGKVCV